MKKESQNIYVQIQHGKSDSENKMERQRRERQRFMRMKLRMRASREPRKNQEGGLKGRKNEDHKGLMVTCGSQQKPNSSLPRLRPEL